MTTIKRRIRQKFADRIFAFTISCHHYCVFNF